MAISNNHKLALLYMMRELLLRTDEDHVLSAADLIKILKTYGYEADRRTIYSNVEILRKFGLDIIKKNEHRGYYIGAREFELPELKLLVDAVQSSKFITAKKSKGLIDKLMTLTNEQKAKQLNREVYIWNRPKSGNEKVYINVDLIHEAMGQERQVEFQYGELKTTKRLVAKRDGEYYAVSPWALTWDDENYYLVGYDEAKGEIKHYRVDKIMRIELSEKSRNGKAEFKDFDLAAFMKKTFGMFGGKEAKVTLRCQDVLAGVIIDRFGKDVMLLPDKKGYFKVHLPIVVSPQVFGWVTAIGEGMEIVSPPSVRREYQAYLDGVLKKYRK